MAADDKKAAAAAPADQTRVVETTPAADALPPQAGSDQTVKQAQPKGEEVSRSVEAAAEDVTAGEADGHVEVIFRGHQSPQNNTEYIKTEDGTYGVGDKLRLDAEKLASLRTSGLVFDPVD